MKLEHINKGKYIPVNPSKYSGNIDKITYRSEWERLTMRWLDLNPDVVAWNSEDIKIKYICGTDGKWHNYHMDFIVKFKNGKVLMIEIKPKKQTVQPVATQGKKKSTLLTESLAWVKNNSKWKAAIQYAKDNNIEFQIWTEDTLKRLRIMK